MLSLKENILRLNQRIKLLNRLGFDIKVFFLPVSLSFIATLLEGITLVALVPFVKGIIGRDFQFIRETPVFDKLTSFGFINPSNTGIFTLLLFTIFFSAILKNVFSYFSAISIIYQVKKFSARLRLIVLDRYIKFGKMFFDRNSAGNLQYILSGFTGQIGGQLSALNNAVGSILMLILYYTAMCLISWKVTLFIIISFPVFNLMFNGLIRKIKHSSEHLAKTSIALSARLFNILSCMTLVKLYNNEERERSNFAAQNKQLRQAEFSIDKKTNLLFPLQEISFLILTLLIVSLMAYLFVKERTGSLASYMIYFYLLRRSQQGMGVFNSLKVAFASISGPVNAIKNILSDEEKYFVPQGNVEFKGLKEKIEYNHLNFSYYKDRQIIHDLSFSIEKGKKVALVGATGAGKTTLVSLLLRFYDCPAGSVLIDGVDIRSFTTKSLLERFACVSQETLLFSDTLRANIVYGLKSPPSDEALSEALKKARLSDFVASLPQGLETYIGDRGVKLSGGEKQRVAITRAMLKAGEILILDEATSSLDSVTERLIQEAIEEVVKDKTVIVIAHRLSTVKNTDKIVVIESGRFIEEGTLQQLIDKKGKFYEYWQEQKFY